MMKYFTLLSPINIKFKEKFFYEIAIYLFIFMTCI